MKNILLLTFMSVAFSLTAFGQDTRPAQPVETPQPNPDVRANVLQQIGLAPEQIRQIRRLNMERKPVMDAAQRRLRIANRDLDEAIYSDTSDEALIQERLKEAQLAQADLIRLRSMNEFAIRRILTPEQLTKFRDLRQRFETARENIQTQRQLNRQMRTPDKGNSFGETTKKPEKRKDPQRPDE